MKAIHPKNIKVGYIYKVRIKNLFDDGTEIDYFYYRELVLAKNRNGIMAIVLNEIPVSRKDKIKLLSYNMKQFCNNDEDVMAKYDEQIIPYDTHGTTIEAPMCDVEFIKEYRKFE